MSLNNFKLKFTGEGNFGEVFEGIASKKNKKKQAYLCKVAVKKIKNNDNITEFFKEASAASKLDHENIVGFFGICLSYNSIICELMEGGQLREYLKSNKYGLTVWDLVNISHDIVKGCEYMERKKFVHRDLAARNCLLTSTNSSLRKVNPKNV